jgi:thiosulfate/3-mercaptopyruvate sulfurtransferase
VENLVTSEALAAELGAADLVVCDATLYMPGDPRDARARYAAARIPGARFFDLNAIADTDSALPHMVPAVSRFERMMSELGIANTSRVVFYDQLGLFSAARAWWLLRLFGHGQVAVLDGGLPKWQREGRALDAREPAAAPSGLPAPTPAPGQSVSQLYQASLHALRLRGIGDMLENARTQRELVLDARSGERFHARVPEPRAGVRAGHMPGARNIPYGELLGADQTLLPRAALRERFARAGVDAGTAVVTSCGSGVTAAVLTLGLAVAGLPEGALYDGSWTEWGGRDDTPVVTS